MFAWLIQNGVGIMQMLHSQFPSALPVCEYGAHLGPLLPLEGRAEACHVDFSLSVNS